MARMNGAKAIGSGKQEVEKSERGIDVRRNAQQFIVDLRNIDSHLTMHPRDDIPETVWSDLMRLHDTIAWFRRRHDPIMK
jgi:hypothetical protein